MFALCCTINEGNENNKMSIGGDANHVRSKYGASTEQVRSKSRLGCVSKPGKIRKKRKDNCCFSYEKKVYWVSEKVSTERCSLLELPLSSSFCI